MGGVRKHVDHARTDATIACSVHQQAGIARQGGGVATDVHNAFGELPSTAQLGAFIQFGHGLGQGKRTFTRWVNEPLVGYAIGHEHVGRHLKQIARNEGGWRQSLAVTSHALIAGKVVSRSGHQSF